MELVDREETAILNSFSSFEQKLNDFEKELHRQANKLEIIKVSSVYNDQ